MAYGPIDGDISDFIDAMGLTDEYFTADLHTYLTNEGHAETDIVEAIGVWQEERFQRIDPSWVRFTLTPAGRAAVEALRARNLHP